MALRSIEDFQVLIALAVAFQLVFLCIFRSLLFADYNSIIFRTLYLLIIRKFVIQRVSKFSRADQLQCDSKGATAYGTRVLLDDEDNTLIRLLNSSLNAGSALSFSTRCFWTPTGPVAAACERESPRVGSSLIAIAGATARAFSSAVVTREGECRSSPLARGRVSGAGPAAVVHNTRSPNERLWSPTRATRVSAREHCDGDGVEECERQRARRVGCVT